MKNLRLRVYPPPGFGKGMLDYFSKIRLDNEVVSIAIILGIAKEHKCNQNSEDYINLSLVVNMGKSVDTGSPHYMRSFYM